MYQRFHECYELKAKIDPASRTSVVNGGWIAMKGDQEIIAIINVGAIASSGTVDAKLQQANTAAGGGAKDIDDAEITQLGATDDNVTLLISCHAQELDDGFRWVRLAITPATAASIVGANVFTGYPRRKKAGTSNYEEVIVV